MFIVLIVGILAVFGAQGVHSRGGLRVYRGEADTLNEFAFAVMLQLSVEPYNKFCSGSLIATNWVLTAAHCVEKKKAREIVIRYGDFTKPRNKTKLYSRVINVYVYPNYKRYKKINDIALILVEKILKKPHTKLLALDYKTLFGLPVKYAGFGYTFKEIFIKNPAHVRNSQRVPLQVGEGVVVPCEKYTPELAPNYLYSALCIAPKCSNEMQQARPGDSGGPLVYDGRIIGVARSIEEVLPITYYTEVSPHLEWIQNTVNSHGNASSN